MSVGDLTRKQLLALPKRERFDSAETVTSLVLLPQRRRHDSGYRFIVVVGVLNGEPTKILSECSDVVNVMGMTEKWGRVSIDFLPVSGAAHLFWEVNGRLPIPAPEALSSFQLFPCGEPWGKP